MGVPAYPVDRIWDYVDRSGGPDACWEWTGFRLTNGAGQIRLNGQKVTAYRAAYFISRGLSPTTRGGFVCHACDNRLCCNPAHLWLGDAASNNADMAAKQRNPAGEAHYRAKLSESDVKAIRTSELSHRALARFYGMHPKTISDIRSRKVWQRIA